MTDDRIDKINRFRFALAEWLAGFDTRLMEFGIAGGTIINGVSALYDNADGKPIAPYLESALRFLARDPSWWAMALIVLGLFVLVALAIGTRRGHGKFPRGVVMLLCAAFYIAVTIAIITGRQTWIVALRYVFTLILSLFCALVLVVEAMIERKARTQ